MQPNDCTIGDAVESRNGIASKMLVLGGGMLPDHEGDFFLAVCEVENAVRPLLVSKKVGSMKLVVVVSRAWEGMKEERVPENFERGVWFSTDLSSQASFSFLAIGERSFRAHDNREKKEGDGFEYVMGTLRLFSLSHNNLKYSMKQFNTAITDASLLANLVDPRFLGPLLEEMVSNMKKKSENRLIPDRKMFVYSGHDTTVANFLNTLGVFDPQCPPYDALVLIELRQNSAGKYFVSLANALVVLSSTPEDGEIEVRISVSASNMVFDCCAHAHIGGGGEEGGTASSVGWSGYLSAYVADGMSNLLANAKVNPFDITD
uniref:acid phosphatase n=1 Tax=Timema californicum TaxID=61474 RepID=A0A7R9J653_TIMCA|nr:unnamed protein product [Timema californicum]